MNIKYMLILLGLLLSLATACATQPSASVPEVEESVIIPMDTATVTKGPVETVTQYKAIVRMQSEGLFFAEKNLPFDAYTCIAGQRVREGEVLARLENKSIREALENLQKALVHTREGYQFENELLSYDITLAQLAQTRLQNEAAYGGNEARMALEQQRLAVQYLQLALKQNIERQTLTLAQMEMEVEQLRRQLAGTVIRAPYDGTITFLNGCQPSMTVNGNSPVLYISDGQTLFVQYDNFTSIAGGSQQALIHEQPVTLAYMPMAMSDIVFYTRYPEGANPHYGGPVRFRIVESEVAVSPGDFVYIYTYDGVREPVLRIPINALFRSDEVGYFVYRVIEGRKEVQPVEIGFRTVAYVEIISGLEEGEDVFVKQ